MKMNTAKIPKIIHCCWFGRNPLPQLAQDCINSWKEHLPDYEIIVWNEDNFDISSNRFTREAYEAKRWAFVTDYVRAYVLYEYGGIYMDTDVEVLKNLDKFLDHSAFTGFENDELIPTGIMGAERQNKWIGEIVEYYHDKSFYKSDGKENIKPNTFIITALSEKYGFVPGNQYQVLDADVHIYSNDFFCPKSPRSNEIILTENSYTIHHFAGSWLPKNRRIKKKMRLFWMSLIGTERYNKISFALKKLGRK